ncbi:hypothetical protein Glove_735g1 [Diversispora epigaea]|uniref:Uncharacterized protein n=1 Tax=Diversispora epigaea TaxID=1348612 RepID=A0A397G0X8_9GLOM|nr:hypothetical protein Glove_735g1 [Diversispora epigaea]
MNFRILDAFELSRNLLQNNCFKCKWTGDYIISLIQGILKLDGICFISWREILVLATQHYHNNEKDINIEKVTRSHLADLLYMFNDLKLKFLYSDKDESQLYIIEIQTYMTEVSVYLIEKRELERRIKSSMEYQINSLIQKFDIIFDNNDGFKTPPSHVSDNKKIQETSSKQPKKKEKK